MNFFNFPSPAFTLWLIILALPPGLHALLVSTVGVGGLGLIVFMAFLLYFEAITNRRITFGVNRTLVYLASLAVLYSVGAVYTGGIANPATMGAVYVFVSMPIVYLITLNTVFNKINHDSARRLVTNAVLISLTITAIAGLLQYFKLIPNPDFAADGIGFVDNKNHFGYLMAVGLAISIAKTTYSRTSQNFFSFLSVLFSVAILISLCRGAWVAAVLIIVLYSLIFRRFGILAILTCFVFLAFQLPDFTSRLQQSDMSSGRLDLWLVIVPKTWADALWGKGVGFMWKLTSFDINEYGGYVSDKNEHIYAHNDFLFLLVETGITGVILWCISLYKVITSALTKLRLSAQKSFSHSQALMILFLSVVIVLGQMVDTIFFGSIIIIKAVALLSCADAPFDPRRQEASQSCCTPSVTTAVPCNSPSVQ